MGASRGGLLQAPMMLALFLNEHSGTRAAQTLGHGSAVSLASSTQPWRSGRPKKWRLRDARRHPKGSNTASCSFQLFVSFCSPPLGLNPFAPRSALSLFLCPRTLGVGWLWPRLGTLVVAAAHWSRAHVCRCLCLKVRPGCSAATWSCLALDVFGGGSSSQQDIDDGGRASPALR